MEIGLKQQKLIAPSITRMVKQIASLDRIEEALEAVYQSLQYMKSNDNRDFNSSTRDATYFNWINSFEFITSNILHDTLLTVQLQERKIDIVASLTYINLLKARVKDLHDSVDECMTNPWWKPQGGKKC